MMLEKISPETARCLGPTLTTAVNLGSLGATAGLVASIALISLYRKLNQIPYYKLLSKEESPLVIRTILQGLALGSVAGVVYKLSIHICKPTLPRVGLAFICGSAICIQIGKNCHIN